MTSTNPTNPITRGRMRRILRQLGIDSAYVLLGFPLAIAAFVIVVTGLSLGAGLLVTLLGVPVLVATVYAARGFAKVERLRMPPVLRMPRVRVTYRGAAPDVARWRRMVEPLGDGQSWLDVLHAVVRLPVSTAGFSIVFTWWVTAFAGLLAPAYYRWLPRDETSHDLPELLGFGTSARAAIVFYVILGLVFAVTLPFVVRGCALVEAWLARILLTGLATLRDQVSTAQQRTAAAASAEAVALRRLERDIHDGPQQRLVRLAVDLGRAKLSIDTDPDAARQSVDEAMTQAREALDELRTLSRGIAPPVLTDRGLPAAVAALAARNSVPTELDLANLGRLPALAEQTAYFTVAEALANAAKHSHARACTVAVALVDGVLAVTVTDDGVGGAHLAKGHGLAGLAERLRSAGGRLDITSPAGGPTRIHAELPCP